MSAEKSSLSTQLAGMAIAPKTDSLIESAEKENTVRASEQTTRRTDDLTERICSNLVHDMSTFGIFVLDNFLGPERGNAVYEDVHRLQATGVFRDGQLVRTNSCNNEIRGDRIAWMVGNETAYPAIRHLVTRIDYIVRRAVNRPDNGMFAKYRIDGRTKAMVACYPGNGAHYVKHVDNPNSDGRCVTAIYYLNKNWDVKTDGGLLRIFPENVTDKSVVAEIEPLFDRMLFFWSDRRNPHEVLPAFKTRYAITIWYYDAPERQRALTSKESQSTVEERISNGVSILRRYPGQFWNERRKLLGKRAYSDVMDPYYNEPLFKQKCALDITDDELLEQLCREF